MKAGLIILGIITVVSSFFTRVTEMNKLKEAASKAYFQEDFLSASLIYQELQRKYGSQDEKLIINLAHSLFQASKYGEAAFYYERLRNSAEEKIRSIALNQLGIISYNTKDKKLALKYFKLAIIENPENDIAVYNYELVKKAQQQSSKSSADKQTEDQNPENIESSGKKGRGKKIGSKTVPDDEGNDGDVSEEGSSDPVNNSSSGMEGDEQNFSQSKENTESGKKNNLEGDQSKEEIVANKLQKYGISPSQAYQILEAMKREELKYIQQIKHKSGTKDNTGPDY